MRIIIISLLVLNTILAIAQDTNDENDRKVKINSSRDRFAINLNADNFYEKPDTLATKWYSRGMEVYLYYDRPFTQHSPFSIAPGIGIGASNYFINSFITIDTNGISNFTQIPNSLNYKKFKLSTLHADLPIELRFRTKPDHNGNSFKLGFGIKVGYLLGNHTKYKGEDLYNVTPGLTTRKELGLKNMSQWRYGVTTRIGYGIFNVVGYYGLSPVFQFDKGPNVKAFSLGFSLNGF